MRAACPCGKTFRGPEAEADLRRHVLAEHRAEAFHDADGYVVIEHVATVREAWEIVKLGMPVVVK